MTGDFKKIPETYEVIHTEYIDEIKSMAGLLRHKKSGAKVVLLSNNDNNKTFSIGFRTPPHDSTGVAHIMEHSVLCGSKNFPAKDPFVELVKGSLNTFLNAMTYPDKTIYPLASCNDTDFQNLMHIYLDAVFHPNIYIHDEIFRQEGWHYELADKDAPLIYNGVVYNEMKGALSSPEQLLFRKISDTLYPDTIYSVESGGDPEVIPELTYEQFLDFHRQYYHPSNSYIYLYGDMDMNEKLEFIDREYLQFYDTIEVDSAISKQQPFDKMSVSRGEYPIGNEDRDENAAYMAYSWVTGDSLDPELYIAFQILEYALLEAPGAPLKQALLDKGYGEDIYGSFETSIIQPYLSIIIKNINEADRDDIVELIQSELKKLASGALNHKTLEGALNFYEFKSKEGDFGRWPKGLMYGLQLIDSWLYDDNKPFIHLKFQSVYNSLKKGIEKGYFEQLIEKYLIDNTHASVYLLCPSKGLNLKKEQVLAEKLAAYKASLSDKEIEQLIADTQALKQYQSEPSPKEVLEMIPLLTIDDIKKEAEPLENNLIDFDDISILHHNIETNGIGYVNMLFDIHHIEKEEVPYLGLLTELFGNLDTDHYTYQELTDEVNLYTGGLRTSMNVYGLVDKDSYRPFFEFSGKALYEKLPKAFALFEEMMLHTHFDNEKRIKEILNQLKSRLEMDFMSAGHSNSVRRATSYFSQGTWYKELCEGIAFYQFICDILRDYDQKKQELIAVLERLTKKIFRKEYLLFDVIADQTGLEICKKAVAQLNAQLYTTEMSEEERAVVYVGVCPTHNEAFITAGTVQYNACAGDFLEKGLAYDGSMHVLKNVLGNEYLWVNVRVKGGAYGCMCGFSLSGNGYFTSYRDPNLDETYAIYDKAADYIASLELDERELTKYIIGAIGAVDTPMTASMRGVRSLAAYLSGISYEAIQQSRDELLATTVEKLREQAAAVDAVVKAGHICVIGSESKITSQKDKFEHISQLIQ